MKEAVRQRARELGFDDCRFTTGRSPASADKLRAWLEGGNHGEMGWLLRNSEKRMDPSKVLPDLRSVITVATSYYQGSESTRARGKGVVARYARGADYHDVLARKLKELTAFVQETAGPETKSLWYVDTGPILERDLAQRAGLGFVGKHTNLISRTLGNWFFISEILTTAELEPDEPEHNRCGTCERCLHECPTKAIRGPFQLDARRCISYLTIELKGSIPMELRSLLGNRVYGCDDCLAVCPWNRFAREGRLMREVWRQDFTNPDLLELLRFDDNAFRERFSGTPMLRTKRRGLLRNVCVALGNTAGEEALAPLQRAAEDPEPLIREHALWAIEQIAGRIKGST